jgi:hypothetical protein
MKKRESHLSAYPCHPERSRRGNWRKNGNLTFLFAGVTLSRRPELVEGGVEVCMGCESSNKF